LKETLEHALDF